MQNSNITENEVKDYGSETKSQNPCGRGTEGFCRILVCFSSTEMNEV